MFWRFYRWCRGNLRVSVIGGEPEALLNRAAEEEIGLWDPVPIPGGFEVSLYPDDYRAFARMARRRALRTELLKKRGLPFYLHRHRKRIGIPVGLLLGLCCVMVLQNFVWRIEVVGNERISAQALYAAAAKEGVHIGAFLPTMDLKTISLRLENAFPDAAWLSVNRNGSLLSIELHETTPKIPPEDDQTVRNIVAAKDGQIVAIEAYRGSAEAAVGDVVTKGQLLISGIVTGKLEKSGFRSALGKVEAQTVEQKTFTLPVAWEKRVYQKEKVCRYLVFGSKKIPLFFSAGLPEHAEAYGVERPVVLFGVKLPFSLMTAEYHPYTTEPVTLTPDEARLELEKQCAEYERQLPAGIGVVSKTTEFSQDGEQFSLNATYVFLEDIAQYAEILLE